MKLSSLLPGCAALVCLLALSACSEDASKPAGGGGGAGGAIPDSGVVDSIGADLRLPPDARTGCYTTEDHSVKPGDTCGCTEDLFMEPDKHASCPGPSYTCIADPCSHCTCRPADGDDDAASTGFVWVCINLLC